jgi:hypothetical protein
MSSWMRALASVLALGLAITAGAEEGKAPESAPAPETAAPAPAEAPAEAKPEAPAGEQPGEPEAAEPAEPVAPEAEAAPAPQSARPAPHVVTLGPVGYDAAGQAGRIHTVASGDTLWDISDAYLGTPWVWPSIWAENTGVDNPHLIRPGDKLWISPSEIRRVSDAEAGALMGGAPGAASLDESGDGLPEGATRRPPTYRVTHRDGIGLVSEEELEGASSLVDALTDRTWLGTMDRVHISTVGQDVEPGEQLVLFRARERVYDPSSGRAVGWKVNVLGWVEVKEAHGDVALAEVRMAYSEIRVGDRLLPRERLPIEVELRPTPPGIEGQIVALSDARTTDGTLDTVFLDRGAEDGLEVGSTLQIYRPTDRVRDPISGDRVQLPPRVVGSLVVVTALPHSASAVVAEAVTELTAGDRFRSAEAAR